MLKHIRKEDFSEESKKTERLIREGKEVAKKISLLHDWPSKFQNIKNPTNGALKMKGKETWGIERIIKKNKD